MYANLNNRNLSGKFQRRHFRGNFEIVSKMRIIVPAMEGGGCF